MKELVPVATTKTPDTTKVQYIVIDPKDADTQCFDWYDDKAEAQAQATKTNGYFKPKYQTFVVATVTFDKAV